MRDLSTAGLQPASASATGFQPVVGVISEIDFSASRLLAGLPLRLAHTNQNEHQACGKEFDLLKRTELDEKEKAG